MPISVSKGRIIRKIINVLNQVSFHVHHNHITSPSNHQINIPIRLNAIVAPTVPAPITATLEAVGVGIVA